MKYDVITIGDVSEDVFIKPREMKVSDSRSVVSGKIISFELGEKIPIDTFSDEIGGSAANIAVGLSRMGVRAGIISAMGEDDAGIKIVRRLEQEGVDTSCLDIKPENKTNFSLIMNTEDGERTIFVYHAIDYELIQIKKKYDTRWFYLGPIGDNAEHIKKALINITAEGRSLLAWNPGSAQIREDVSQYKVLLKNTTILFLNREEAIKFLNQPVRPKDEEVMKRLHRFGPQIVVVTDGQAGAKAYDGELFYHIDIISNRKVDATGAGDSFAVGFLGKLMLEDHNPHPNPLPERERELEKTLSPLFHGERVGVRGISFHYNKELISDALKYGIVNSTSVVAQIGAQPGLLSVQDIEKGISEHPRMQVEVY